MYISPLLHERSIVIIFIQHVVNRFIYIVHKTAQLHTALREMAKPISPATTRALVKKIKQACLDNNPNRAKELLLDWGHLTWPDQPPASIGDIAGRSSEALATELRLLNNALYSRSSGNWQGRELWAVFEHDLMMSEEKSETNQGKLEPLFKI